MDEGTDRGDRRRRLAFRAAALWAVGAVFLAGTVGAMLLYQNIATRKREALSTALRIVDLTETTVDPVEWGKNFPRQYDGYVRTADNLRTRYGGSEAMPARLSTGEATDRLAAESKLEADPRLAVIFNGYAFAIDYRERRGHAFMLTDQRETERVTRKQQPGACLNCHASNVVAFRKVGIEKGAGGSLDEPLLSAGGLAQLLRGFEEVNRMPYGEATKLVSHPVTCLDCHDPKTMAVRITKPGFLEGVAALARSDDAVPHLPSVERWRREGRRGSYDPNAMATRQEMRSMACAQCHVEYSFQGEGKRLTYPWHNGLRAEHAEAWYDSIGFSDWTHADSGAKVLKAQHPEFEMWSQGIHARSGVSCADCHMPYTREGALKFSDHQVRSPMLNVARACQTCHNYTETEIKARVATIQDRTRAQMVRAEDAVVDLIRTIQSAKAAGAGDGALAGARDLQRRAQWRTDYVNAENSMGFHASQEAMRLLGESIDYARRGVAEAMKAGGRPPEREGGGAPPAGSAAGPGGAGRPVPVR